MSSWADKAKRDRSNCNLTNYDLSFQTTSVVLLLGRLHVQVAAIQEGVEATLVEGVESTLVEGVEATLIAPLLEEELVEEIFVRKHCL